MAYDVTLVQVNASIRGFGKANTNFGFPAGVPFDTLLFSYWTCLPTGVFSSSSNGGPQYILFFGVNAEGGATQLTLGNMAHATQFYSATFTGAPANVRANHLISVNCHTQTVQYYVNDVAQSVTSGGWTAVGQFQVPSSVNIWDFDIGSNFGLTFPAFADLWFGATSDFVDLSIEGNRRKFINADLTPIDLGSNGSTPFGAAPQIFQTIPSGGVPNDFLVNRGIGGGSFGLTLGSTLSFQTPGTCHLPPPPPVNVNIDLTGVEADFGVTAPTSISGTTTIALSELEVTDLELSFTSPVTSDEQVTLRWSDDAGASWSNGLLKTLGKPGEYFTTPTWYRLGMSRNRILELSWSGARAEALQGVFVEVTISAT